LWTVERAAAKLAAAWLEEAVAQAVCGTDWGGMQLQSCGEVMGWQLEQSAAQWRRLQQEDCSVMKGWQLKLECKVVERAAAGELAAWRRGGRLS
jgi:hypothetical protein